jgi:hypothetical protein
MTEEVYAHPVKSFAVSAVPAATVSVPVLENGRAALEKINKVRRPRGPRALRCRARFHTLSASPPARALLAPSPLLPLRPTPIHIFPLKPPSQPAGDGPRL